MTNPQDTGSHEHFASVKEAATELHIHPRALSRAVQRGFVPAYRPFGSRRIYVRLSEVVAAVSAAKIGGAT